MRDIQHPEGTRPGPTSELSELLTACATAGLCVKVGRWCAELLTAPGSTLPLIPRPITWHAQITGLRSPSQWGATAQGWGTDPAAALTMAMDRYALHHGGES